MFFAGMMSKLRVGSGVEADYAQPLTSVVPLSSATSLPCSQSTKQSADSRSPLPSALCISTVSGTGLRAREHRPSNSAFLPIDSMTSTSALLVRSHRRCGTSQITATTASAARPWDLYAAIRRLSAHRSRVESSPLCRRLLQRLRSPAVRSRVTSGRS